MSEVSARYVVLVREPLPDDLRPAVIRLTDAFDLSPERATRLLQRAPGALTRPVLERDARSVAAVLRSAGLLVEVREGSAQGPVMEWLLPDLDDRGKALGDRPYQQVDPALTLAGTRVEAARAAEASRQSEPALPPAAPRPEPQRSEPKRPEPQRSEPQRPEPQRSEPQRSEPPRSEPDPRSTYVPGMTVPTPPRDPNKTTLVREPPKLDRGGLQRLITTAAVLPAFLTLLVTLLALVVTLLPLLRNAEQRRAASTANAVAATLEGLSGGLPLNAPLVRAQVSSVAERTAQRLPAEGTDFLVVLDAEGAPVVAWYRGQLGLENVPSRLLTRLEAAAQEPAAAGAPAAGVGAALRTTWDDLLAVAGLAPERAIVAVAGVRRGGAHEGMVLAGSEGPSTRADVGWALLTALLVGLVPVLFGVLAAMSLSRGVRNAIVYLLRATDRISHGDLEHEVQLKRDDELGQIARAVERMRVSLREAMERLRRR